MVAFITPTFCRKEKADNLRYLPSVRFKINTIFQTIVLQSVLVTRLQNPANLNHKHS
jgi:hypothetical protein